MSGAGVVNARGRARAPVVIAIVTLAWLVLVLPVAAGGPDAGPAPRTNQALRATLVRLMQEDQAEAQESYRRAVRSRAAARQAVLKQIITAYGWPGVSLVGADGAAGAWIVAQHADDDVAFQRECLRLLEEAHRRGDVPGAHLAYLTDRVLSNERRPQRYGTQGAPVYSPAERAEVDARRRALGMPSMAESARRKARFYEEAYRQAAQGR